MNGLSQETKQVTILCVCIAIVVTSVLLFLSIWNTNIHTSRQLASEMYQKEQEVKSGSCYAEYGYDEVLQKNFLTLSYCSEKINLDAAPIIDVDVAQ